MQATPRLHALKESMLKMIREQSEPEEIQEREGTRGL